MVLGHLGGVVVATAAAVAFTELDGKYAKGAGIAYFAFAVAVTVARAVAPFLAGVMA
jgi:hypothetical protein